MHLAGWDIGGVNVKVALIRDGGLAAARQRPFEVQRALDALPQVLQQVARDVGVASDAAHAVTMTAELSQAFRTKREGVAFVLDAVERAFPGAPLHVFTVDGRFVSAAEARTQPLLAAAANWAATAGLVAQRYPDVLLVDTGSTTTDVIPIVSGRVVARGRTDPDRLSSGELVYTGALRTPVEAIASEVPVRGEAAGVAAEGFALAADVHLWRGGLLPDGYMVPTPDGRPASREFAGERIARVVCADREMLDDADVSAIAAALAEAQADRIATAIRRVVARHPSLRTAVVTGAGAFLAEAAARRAGLAIRRLSDDLGTAAAVCAPAAAVGLLLDRELTSGRAGAIPQALAVSGTPGREDAARGARHAGSPARHEARSAARCLVDVVVKLGGGMLTDVSRFEAVMAVVGRMCPRVRVLVVPGGGPFADAVRDLDRRVPLGDDAAHWMAILGMDQYAHLLAARLPTAAIVRSRDEIAAAVSVGRLPVLAPSAWLRCADPVPHSWDVTSDSIAAWVSGAIGASRLILVKPPRVRDEASLDAAFRDHVPPGVEWLVVAADDLDGLADAMTASPHAPARNP
jgi:probable H4MPT-linked C1 transfer pathway protein